MKALSSLSKYLGVYDIWLETIKKFQLKWVQKGGYSAFEKIFDANNKDYVTMLNWITNSINKLPTRFWNLIIFNTLTGLRPYEAYKAANLIQKQHSVYIDKEGMLLLHYKFPDKFLRISKKAYLSVINTEILEIATNTISGLSYHSLRKKFIKCDLNINMSYCRKVFATYLRNKGMEPEIIDLLQGRTPSSIFVNHYYRPDISEIITKKIGPVLDELKAELIL